MRARAWLVVGLSLACGPRQVASSDEAAENSSEVDGDGDGEAGSTESSTSDSTSDTDGSTGSTDTSDAESSSESGPTPDIPDDLPDECVPVPFIDDEYEPIDAWSGWVHCKDSFFRIEAIDCPFVAGYEPCDDPSLCDPCDPSEECLDYYSSGSGYCFCGNNCTSDSDCADNEICACRSGLNGAQLIYRNTCLPADCTGQADCAAVPDESVPRCRLGLDICAGPESVHCRTEVDACIYEDDCPDNWCRYDSGDERWTCDEFAICE